MNQHREGIKSEGVKAQPRLAPRPWEPSNRLVKELNLEATGARFKVSELPRCCVQNACLLVRAPARKKQHLLGAQILGFALRTDGFTEEFSEAQSDE